MELRIIQIILLLSLAIQANALTLTSPAFKNNGIIPNEYTYSLGGQCNGQNISPPLVISDVPEGTKSLSINVIDPDGGNWIHWQASNINPQTVTIAQNSAAYNDYEQGFNSFNTQGYAGPCPPTPNHRYIFTLSAVPNSSITQTITTTLTGIRSPTDNLSTTLTNSDLSDSDRLFNWAESKYSNLFSPMSKVTLQGFGYYYRYYSSTNSYLGVKDGSVFYLDSNGNLSDVGLVSDYLPTAISDGF